MHWKWTPPLSLKNRLVAWVLPALLVYSGASLYLARQDVIDSIDTAYDRSLLGAIKSIDANVSSSSGSLSIELPYRLFELFQLTATGNVYFKVASINGLVEVGNTDLPKPPLSLTEGNPYFYDAEYFGEVVRIGAYLRPDDHSKADASVKQWIIQVAESKKSRDEFADKLIRQAMLREILSLILVWLVLTVGLIFAIRPLARLEKQTRAKAPEDLSELPLDSLPKELVPLVQAVNIQIKRTEKVMADRRGFIDDASHQLRTPISILRMQLDYALREDDLEKKNGALQALSEEMAKAIRSMNQLLALGQSDAAAVEMQSFDIVELIKDVVLEFLPLARNNRVDLGIEMASEHLLVVGDKNLIQHALANIIHNAVRHCSSKGSVTVKASMHDAHVHVNVTDEGPGIPDWIVSRLGERFVKGEHTHGSGLGLAIADSVIKKHHGKIEIISNKSSQGTEVKLIWPSV